MKPVQNYEISELLFVPTMCEIFLIVALKLISQKVFVTTEMKVQEDTSQVSSGFSYYWWFFLIILGIILFQLGIFLTYFLYRIIGRHSSACF